MDVEHALRELRRLAASIQEYSTADKPDNFSYIVRTLRMAELFRQLDAHMVSTGELPGEWIDALTIKLAQVNRGG